MLFKLLLGCGMLVGNLGIQIWSVGLMLHYLRWRSRDGTPGGDFRILAAVMLFLLLGHLLQFATWAVLFIVLGEFSQFETALYHSIVNFTSLGYGDIVMDEQWRLLGALEAANGVLMFGLTAGLLLSVFSLLLRQRPDVDALLHGGADESARR